MSLSPDLGAAAQSDSSWSPTANGGDRPQKGCLTTNVKRASAQCFGRSVQDSANLLARIRAADGVLCTVAEGIDTSGYMGKFLTDLFAALGELELARIRENWDTARKSAVARGIHVSGKCRPATGATRTACSNRTLGSGP